MLSPAPGFLAVGLFPHGELAEVIDDQEDARSYLRELVGARCLTT